MTASMRCARRYSWFLREENALDYQARISNRVPFLPVGPGITPETKAHLLIREKLKPRHASRVPVALQNIYQTRPSPPAFQQAHLS